MWMFAIYLVFFLSALAKGAAKECCPSCSVRSIDPLNSEQKAQIRSNRALIQQIQQDPRLIYNSTYQRSIVTLTRRQQLQILRNFPEQLMSRADFERVQSGSGGLTEPGDGTAQRRKRQAMKSRVCMPKDNTDPLILAVTPPDNQVVELIQMPGQGKNQWILGESCAGPSSPLPCGLECDTVMRAVPALFIHLNVDNYPFDFAFVSVESCVTVQ